jgi:hypothetical protein
VGYLLISNNHVIRQNLFHISELLFSVFLLKKNLCQKIVNHRYALAQLFTNPKIVQRLYATQ